MNNSGVIYILTNPSFSDYVKIGYADDVVRRVKELNRSECIPFSFRVYATYEVDSRLSDVKLHSIIDRLNPNLRSIETSNGKKRVREFYAMSAEDAYSILEAIAEIHGRQDKLHLYPATEEERMEEEIAEQIAVEAGTRRKSQPISLEEYLENKNPDMVGLYRQLHTRIMETLEDVELHVIPQYIGWRVKGKYFGEIQIQRNRIRLMTLVPKKECCFGEKLPETYLWSMPYRSYIETTADVEETVAVLLDSYRQRAGKVE